MDCRGNNGRVSAYLMRMPKLLFFRIKSLVYFLRDHVLHPDETGVLGGGIIEQTLAYI